MTYLDVWKQAAKEMGQDGELVARNADSIMIRDPAMRTFFHSKVPEGKMKTAVQQAKVSIHKILQFESAAVAMGLKELHDKQAKGNILN